MSDARSITRKVLIGLSASALLATAACSSGTPAATTGGTGGTGGDACAAFEVYGDLTGKTVSLYTSIASSAEAQPHIDSFKPFEECTGATVKYEGSRDFEAQLPVRIKAGNAPDVAYLPQPGLLATLVRENPGKVIKVGDEALANIDKYYAAQWKTYGTVDDAVYGVPVGSNAKSFVWYSPGTFAEKGYQVPTTWDELMALTDKIAADTAGQQSVKPWCAGIESGSGTGWPATDWVEDMMLRTGTPEDYDAWVAGDLKFSDPKVIAALDMAGTILKNDKYVNGGLGGVKTIATTSFTEAGLPILDGTCFLHRQASFYQANWGEGVTVGEDGDVYAFYLPGKTADVKPLLVAGEFAAAFRDAPEVKAFQAYLTSPEWSNAKGKATPLGGWLSANTELDPANLAQPVDRLSYELLTDPATIVRFDGSDLMPSAVGAGSFWKGMTDWIALDRSSADVAKSIDAAWPR